MSAARMEGSASLVLAVLVLTAGVAGAGPATGPERVVALAPSAAEIVAEVGMGERLVGVCDQCDHPASVMAALPSIGSYVVPSVEAVVGLRPDLVVAVPSPGNREAVRELARLGLEVLVVRDRTLDDLWAAVTAIATRLGVPARGASVVGRMQDALGDVRATVAGRPRPTVLLVVGHRPLVVAGGGTLQDELIDVAGGRNLGRRLGDAWPTMSLEVLARETPAIVIDAAMGSEAGMRALLPPVGPEGAAPRVVRIPVDALVRAGPRVVEAARMLARALHPELRP